MSSLYNIARQGFLGSISEGGFTGQLSWNDDVKAVLVTIDEGANPYTFDPNHKALAEIHPDARIAEVDLTGKLADAEGWAVADNATFQGVTGEKVSAVVLCRKGSTDADSILIGYFDDAISGLPITPNGGDITILWNAGSGDTRVFRL